MPISRIASHRFEILVDGNRPSRVAGSDLAVVGVLADRSLFIYVAPKSPADVALHSGRIGLNGYRPQATLLLDGKPIASGFVAADHNVVDPEVGPLPGATGFFHDGADSYAIFWKVLCAQ